MREALPLADFIEVNESCPNVHHGRRGIIHVCLRMRHVCNMQMHCFYTYCGHTTYCGSTHCGSGGAGATDELAARLRAIVAVRDAAARSPGGRCVPVLVKLGNPNPIPTPDPYP